MIKIHLKRNLTIFIIIFTLSCHDDKKNPTIIIEKYKSEFIDTIFYKFGNSNSSKYSYTNLSNKIGNLKKHKRLYKVEKIGKVKTNSSVVHKAIFAKPELCYTARKCIKIKNLNNFTNSILEINYAKLSVTNLYDSNLNLPVTIEEIIFKSEEDAKTLLNYINSVRKVEYFWNTIDKYRSNIFRESNKIYFTRYVNQKIHTGDYPLNIVEILKE